MKTSVINWEWKTKCSECKEYHSIFIIFRGKKVWICLDCLEKAVKLLKKGIKNGNKIKTQNKV